MNDLPEDDVLLIPLELDRKIQSYPGQEQILREKFPLSLVDSISSPPPINFPVLTWQKVIEQNAQYIID